MKNNKKGEHICWKGRRGGSLTTDGRMTRSIESHSTASPIKRKENCYGRAISEKLINGRKNVGGLSIVSVSGYTTKEKTANRLEDESAVCILF
jgi:hypothetical protein